MCTPKKLAIAFTFASLQILSTSTLANEKTIKNEKIEAVFEEIIVIGNLLGQSKAEEVRTYPGNRNIISAEELQQIAARTIDDALQRIPGVKIHDETGTGVLPNVAIRGLNASRSGYTQFLLDGVPLALAPYGHTGQSLFPTSLRNIDRIDIVRGGAAVQYGPNNVGGVINLMTKPIPNYWENSLEEKITRFTGGNYLTDTYLRSGGALNDELALQFEVNQISGESFRSHSNTEVKNWLFKTRWDISSQKILNISLQGYEAETEMPGGLTTQAYEHDRSQSQRLDDEFKGRTTRLSTHYNQQFGQLGVVDAGEFDWMNFAHDSTRNFQWGFSTDPSANHWADPSAPTTHLRSSPREFKVWGSEARTSFQFNGSSISHKLTLGARLIKENIDYKLTQVDNDTGASNTPRDWVLDTTGVASYISDAISLFDGHLTITPGLRHESIKMNFGDLGNETTTKNTISKWLPGITIGYEFNNKWFLYGNAQRSIRAPQIAVIRGSGKEGAELSWNHEAGVRLEPNTGTYLNVSLYRINFTEQLIYNSTQQSFDNVGKTRHQGLELESRYSSKTHPELNLRFAYNFLDSEQREGVNLGKELPYASKHQLSWEASYGLEEFDMSLSGFYFSKSFSDTANIKDEDISGTKGELPSYTIWNLLMSKIFFLDKGNELYTSLSVNNLFNKEYHFRGIDVSPSGRHPAPPRTVSLEVKYSF